MPTNDYLPYQFDLPPDIKRLGVEKARLHGFSLAALFRIHWEQFVNSPIEDSMKLIAEHSGKKHKRRKK